MLRKTCFQLFFEKTVLPRVNRQFHLKNPMWKCDEHDLMRQRLERIEAENIIILILIMVMLTHFWG